MSSLPTNRRIESYTAIMQCRFSLPTKSKYKFNTKTAMQFVLFTN